MVGSKSKVGIWDASWRHEKTEIDRHGEEWHALRGRCLAVLEDVLWSLNDQEGAYRINLEIKSYL